MLLTRTRAFATIGIAAATGLLALDVGCGTSAQGVESCRRIEEARCRQLPYCPAFGVTTPDQVEGCVTFYRDQCLHGLVVADPGPAAIESCVRTIGQAGACASQGITGLAACPDAPSSSTTAQHPCDLIAAPERATECVSIMPPLPPEGTPDAGAPDGPSSDAAAE